jgi:5-formyltetrahydrofolate cyclo-ligase
MPSLRQQLRLKRQSLSKSQQQIAGSALAQRLKSDISVISAKRIAFYQPADGEIDPNEFLNWCRHAGKNIYLPVVPEGLMPNSSVLLFQAYIPGETSLAINRFGNFEPVFNRKLCIKPSYLNLVLMPLVGFDRLGNRLGMGKGYYDRTFSSTSHSFHKPRLIGLAHSIQETSLIPSPWDVPLDAIFTDKEKITC